MNLKGGNLAYLLREETRETKRKEVMSGGGVRVLPMEVETMGEI
jgi:hypothetical protein